MQIQRLHLRAFRNHAATEVEFGPGITLLLGDNGQGKTNVLEAIGYLSLSKSFYAGSDMQVVQLGEDVLEIRASIADDAGHVSDARISVRASTGEKVAQVNGSQLDRVSSLVGMFPSIILSPEQGGIITGGPAERRRFLDLVLSQTSRSYLADVMDYRRVLRQRNRLLLDARLSGTAPAAEITAWTDEIQRLGSRIIQRRSAFVQAVRPLLASAYNFVAGRDSSAGIDYHTIDGVVEGMDVDQIGLSLRRVLDARSAEEWRRGVTLVGPHRDDLAFSINGMAAEQYASQGEQKTMLIALKLAEYDVVTARIGEMPMLLLDDLFAELDRHRAARVIERLAGRGQCIVTAADESLLEGAVAQDHTVRRIYIDHGTCRATPV